MNHYNVLARMILSKYTDLPVPSATGQESAFRTPMSVTQIRCRRSACGLTGFPICPQCGLSLEREYQAYCDRCGQCLDWSGFLSAALILPEE